MALFGKKMNNQASKHAEQEAHIISDEKASCNDQSKKCNENNDAESNAQEQAASQEEVEVVLDQHEESFKIKYLRLSADFSNLERRVIKERAEWMNTAQKHVLRELLPLFDDLDRAIDIAPENNDEEWTKGILLLQKNWRKKLDVLGVKEVAAAGEFDPNLHEAMVQVDAEQASGKASGQIHQVFAKGYTFKDSVIIHAKVSVVK